MKDVKSVVAQLIKDGAEPVKGVTVKNVNVTPMSNFTRVTLTVNKDIKCKRTDDKGNTIDDVTRVIFSSTYSLGALFSEDENLAFAKNYILKQPKMLELILSYAQVDIIVEPVAQGEVYVNPFSNKGEEHPVEHDSYYYHVIAIRPSAIGLKAIDMLQKQAMKAMLASALADTIMNGDSED